MQCIYGWIYDASRTTPISSKYGARTWNKRLFWELQLHTICESNYWFYCFAVMFVQFAMGVIYSVAKTTNASYFHSKMQIQAQFHLVNIHYFDKWAEKCTQWYIWVAKNNSHQLYYYFIGILFNVSHILQWGCLTVFRIVWHFVVDILFNQLLNCICILIAFIYVNIFRIFELVPWPIVPDII